MCTIKISPLLVAALAVTALNASAQSIVKLEPRLMTHPSMKQLDHEIQAAHESATAVGALPDPEVTLGVSNIPVSSPSFNEFLPSHKTIGIKQFFPNSAGRRAQSSRVIEQAKSLNAQAAQQLSMLRAELQRHYVQLTRIEQQRSLVQDQLNKLNELSQVANSEINAGRPALFRLAEIESQRADLAYTQVEFDAGVDEIHASLLALVGIIPEPTKFEIERIVWSGQPEQFHAVRVATIGTSIAEQSIDIAEADWKTNWGVDLAYQQRSSGSGRPGSVFRGDDWFTAKVTFSMPIWGKSKQAPNVRAARAHKASAHANVLDATRRSVARYERFAAQHTAAVASQAALKENIAALEIMMQAQLTQYEAGNGDYTPIIDAEITILMLKARIAMENARELTAIINSNALLVTS